jgi:hypothetical protein
MYPGDAWNPYGYYQRADVLEANDAFVESAGFSIFEGADQDSLDRLGDTSILTGPDLTWRSRAGIWGLKDPRFCVTLMSWYRAGLLGDSVGLIRLRRPPEASARSLLRHPELAAQLTRPCFAEALEVIVRYHSLADAQERLFPGPRISVQFDGVIAGDPATLTAIDRFLSQMAGRVPTVDARAARVRTACF